MELVNLNDLMKKVKQDFNPSLFDNERTIPQAFKQLVPDFEGTTLVYHDYTCVLNERTPGLNIVFPNQWFYIAAYMTDYYHMLQAYKQKVYQVLQIANNEQAKNVIRSVMNNRTEAERLFDEVNYHDIDREWLIHFVSDYSWWGGGKEINRSDFFVSPVLSLAHLVNASQSFVADLCKFLAENPEALEILKSKIATFGSDNSEVKILVNEDTKDSYTEDELSSILKNMYERQKTAGVHIFGLKYGKFLEQYNSKNIATKAGIKESWSMEIDKMKRIYPLIEQNVFNIHFFNPNNKISVSDAFQNTTDEIKDRFKFYFRAMRTKPFLLLAGISGTGKSRIVKQMAFDSCPTIDQTEAWDLPSLREDQTSPGNYCLVEVKPNWHDSSELMGYESQIGTPHYVLTTFVRFLSKAMLYESLNVPFFVCLDEMNLAPVEQYFAEFLSVLESRKVVDGKITSEPLIKAEIFANKDYELRLQDSLFGLELKQEIIDNGKQRIISGKLPDYAQKAYELLKKNGLRIPSNLIVIGTVNMDETTHQFSRKVIDRAMTIEMNLPEGEPFLDFFNNDHDLEYTDSPVSHKLYLPTLVKAADVVEELAEDNADKTEWLKKEVAKILSALNEALNDTPFKIAYRVQNELMLYFHELWVEDKSARWREILNQSVDQILMMKVLPRIEGDEDLLEKPLANLATFCANGNYANAAKKVEEMQKRLERAHFTSYWP